MSALVRVTTRPRRRQESGPRRQAPRQGSLIDVTGSAGSGLPEGATGVPK